MRRTALLSIGIVLLLGVSVGSVVVGATHDRTVTLHGTVTGVDGRSAGDAVVLVGERSALLERSPDELRAAAATDPPELTVVDVGDDGRFATTVDSSRADAAVAVSDAGVGDLVSLRGENATLDLRLYERRPQVVHEHAGTVTGDERRVELYVDLINTDDAAVENLSVSVGALPDGWSVADVRTGGTYRDAERTLFWPSVAPGADVDTTLVVTVPAGTPPGEYAIELDAGSETHSVDAAPVTVDIRPADTPGPTTMPPSGGEDGRTTPSPVRTQTDRSTAPTTGSGPGFGVVGAVVGLALPVALLGRRR
jgi:hypothetical protein